MRWLRRESAALWCAALLVGAASPGCVCSGAPTRDPARDLATFGVLTAPNDAPLDPYVALARAVVAHGERPSVPSAPARRVFLTMFAERAARVTTTALGDDLEKSVVAAAEAIARGDAAAAPFRLELDVVTEVEPIAAGAMTATWGDLGTNGFALSSGRTAFGYVLPSEILFDHRFESGKHPKLADEKLLEAIRARVGSGASPSDEVYYRFRTRAVVESAARDKALALTRSAIDRAPGTTPDELVAAVRLGADYLCRVMDENGRYAYMVHPADAHPDASYGILRHAGTTFALFEAYGETKTPLYLEKGERALGYLEKKFISSQSPEGALAYVLDTNDEEQQKVGGAGLALLAFTEHARASGKKDKLATMRSLARFIVSAQYPDGRFRANRDVEREGKAPPGPALKKELIYYVGEAIFGLMRLWSIDPDDKWLEAAKRAADWCIETRDVTTTDATQEHDHWLSYALMELYKVTKKPSYVEHAFKIARAILLKQFDKNAPAPDFVGAFYAEAPSTPASTRLEAFGADIATARAAGKDDAWLMGPALAMARFTRAQQLDADAVYFARDPARVVGGVRESLFVYDIRIDYVQHAMSAWLHLARLLREKP
jgi:hypothetical protein